MFSASCSPVKISRSKQINAIFITTYISGTVISYEKTVSPAVQTSFTSQYNVLMYGHIAPSRLFLFFNTVQTNHLVFRETGNYKEIYSSRALSFLPIFFTPLPTQCTGHFHQGFFRLRFLRHGKLELHYAPGRLYFQSLLVYRCVPLSPPLHPTPRIPLLCLKTFYSVFWFCFFTLSYLIPMADL